MVKRNIDNLISLCECSKDVEERVITLRQKIDQDLDKSKSVMQSK
jgi:hypothetical protein